MVRTLQYIDGQIAEGNMFCLRHNDVKDVFVSHSNNVAHPFTASKPKDGGDLLLTLLIYSELSLLFCVYIFSNYPLVTLKLDH